jgi:Peptidase family M28
MRKDSHRRSSTLSVGLIATLIAAAGLGEPASGAWFGLKPPSGLSNPHRPVVDVSKLTVPPAVVPPGEERYRELLGPRIYRDVQDIVNFSKQSHARGDKVWGRVTGFPAAKATIEWTAAQFKAAGLTGVEVQEYAAAADSSMWWARNWEAKLLGDAAFGAGSRDIVFASAVPSSGSKIEGGELMAALVHVGANTDASLPQVDVKGKIAVQHLQPQSGAYSERPTTVQRAQALAKRGAVAVINVVEQTGNMHVRDFGNCGVPCFNLGGEDGAFLEAAMSQAASAASAPLRLQLRLQSETLTGLKGHNAIGTVAGKSPEVMIINAHADGWYDAAGDNADGLGVLLAMARHFAAPENRPDRTLVFVASGGHHSAGLNGPTNFVKMNAGVGSKAVMVLNLEHVAQLRIESGTWKVGPAEQQLNFGVDNSSPALLAAGKAAMTRYGFNLNPTFTTRVAGDLGGYAPLGIARVQAIHSGPMYHTSGDVLETISIPGLERAARFYTHFVTEVGKIPAAQINPAAAAKE